jgi:hypothetical protein
MHYRDNHIESETDEDFGERLDQAVERIGREANALGKQLGEAVERLIERHQLARTMAAAQKLADIPTKTLEKRVALIQQIRAIDYLADEDLDRLKLRLQCLETIHRLEPDGPTPIKKLRERARLLERANDDAPRLALVHDADGNDGEEAA